MSADDIDAVVCNAPETTGAIGDDGGPARCTRRPHPSGSMHEGNGLDWYDDVSPSAARPDHEAAAAIREAMAAARRCADNDHPADWTGNYTGKLNALLIDIIS